MQRRRVDVEKTPGRCGNLDYCSIGMQRGLVMVPVSGAFVCPECGGPLRAPSRAMRWAVPLLPLARLGVLLGGVAAALVAGYLAGRAQSPVVRAVGHVQHAALGQIEAVRTALTLPTPEPARSGRASKLASEPFLPMVVPYRPFPARGGPAEPAGRLSREWRSGQVVVDCRLAALVTQPVCSLAAARGTDAFSATAMAWLRQLRVQYAPAPDSHSAELPDHRWRVVFEDYAGQAKRSPP